MQEEASSFPNCHEPSLAVFGPGLLPLQTSPHHTRPDATDHSRAFNLLQPVVFKPLDSNSLILQQSTRRAITATSNHSASSKTVFATGATRRLRLRPTQRNTSRSRSHRMPAYPHPYISQTQTRTPYPRSTKYPTTATPPPPASHTAAHTADRTVI